MWTPNNFAPRRRFALMFSALIVGPLLGQEPTIRVSDPVIPYVIDVDLRNLPASPAWTPGMPIKEVPRRRYGGITVVAEPSSPDPLRDKQFIATLDPQFPTPGQSYDGLGFLGISPPDTVGDVGRNYYIQAVNTTNGAVYIVFDKTTGSLVAGPFSLGNLGMGDCASGQGDPIVLYDQEANRWLISEFPLLCVYISRTSNPINGGWYAYSFSTPGYPDYPHYGVWNDAYYVTTNENTQPPTAGIHALDRLSMIQGQPATMISGALERLAGYSFNSATPADLDGALPPPLGAPGILMRHRDDEIHNPGNNDPNFDFLELYQFSVDFITPDNSRLSSVLNIPISEYDTTLCGQFSQSCFPMPGAPQPALDPVREVIMNRLIYRNFGDYEVLLGNMVTDVDGADTGGIRWWELRRENGPGAIWRLHQEGTHSPDDTNRWMAAGAMDGSGNIAMGFNVSDGVDTYPGLRYTGRLDHDPPGAMTQGEHSVIEGTARNAFSRYGDYSAMSIDPIDDCTFWFTGEYNNAGTWSTRIANFRFEACGCDTQVSAIAVSPQGFSLKVTWDPDYAADSYTLYRSPGNCINPNFKLVAEGLTGATYQDMNVVLGESYAYAIAYRDGVCTSDLSSCGSGTVVCESLSQVLPNWPEINILSLLNCPLATE